MHLYTMANNGEKWDCDDRVYQSQCQMQEMSDSFLLQRSGRKFEDETDGRFNCPHTFAQYHCDKNCI